jgi:negative regulator of flagellin synthesis FlgM
MKIQGTGYVNHVNPYNKNQSRDQAAVSGNKRSDQLSISEEAKALLDQLSGKHDLERRQKVEELKREIESGTYKVEAGKVAEKLMEWWRI